MCGFVLAVESRQKISCQFASPMRLREHRRSHEAAGNTPIKQRAIQKRHNSFWLKLYTNIPILCQG